MKTKQKPNIVKKIEQLLALELTETTAYPDLLTGLMAFKKNLSKYAVEEGKLVGLNLAETGLTDGLWQEIIELLKAGEVRLQALNVNGNQLKDFLPPPGLDDLERLDIEDNPLENPPPELVSQGAAAVIDFFRKQAEQGTDAIYEAKLLLLGQGSAGKTSLCRKLLDTNNPLPGEGDSTRGIDVHALHFPLKNGRQFRMNIWDFGGQAIYHATHQFFLNKRSLYILLDDTRKDDRSAHDPAFRYWLQVCELLGDGSPLLIVQNEKGNRSKELDMASIKGRFDFVTGSLAVNLADCRGLGEVREEIEHLISRLPHVGTPLPRQWAVVREEIEKLSQAKEYITEDEWLERCGKHGVDVKEAQQLSQYFHDIGVFLHFQDEDLLRRTVILKKEWATNAAYRVLDDEMVKQQLRGRFREEDLRRIWHEAHYQRRSVELRALMEKFELCYEILDSKPRQWLVPQLLPPSQPRYEWSVKDNLSLRYRYDFMPKGLLSRIVVRLHHFVTRPDLAWQRGALLERLGTKAEIMELEKDMIRIRVQGDDPFLRKELRSIIAEEFDRLHGTFEKLHVEKLVPCKCSSCATAVEPNFYEYSDLDTRRKKNKTTVECRISYDDVEVVSLLEGIGRVEDGPRVSKSEIRERLTTHQIRVARSPIEQHIANNNMTGALELLRTLLPETTEMLILENQWNQLRQDENAGLLSYEKTTIRRNQIIKALLDLSKKTK